MAKMNASKKKTVRKTGSKTQVASKMNKTMKVYLESAKRSLIIQEGIELHTNAESIDYSTTINRMLLVKGVSTSARV